MAVRGKLKDISLASLISVNCNEMNQSRLVVWRDNEEAVVFFDGGNIVHMTLGNLEGDAVISELLAWEDGEFELEPAVPAPRRTVQTPWSTLLLEGMQHVDESSQAHLMPMDDPVPTPGDKGDAAGLLAKLRAVDGVTGAVIVARDGNVIAADMEGDAEKEGAVAVFVGSAASQIGESLALGPFERGLVETSGSKVRMLILERSEYYAGVLLAERASPTLVAAKVTGILQ
jgi:predicted regulator of Ras-like GTPase activity (Roadblock/LC7/MglB family)